MRGLYAITDASVFDPDVLSRQVGEVLDGGAVHVSLEFAYIDEKVRSRIA